VALVFWRRLQRYSLNRKPNPYMKTLFVRSGAVVGACVLLTLAACGPSDLVGKDKLSKIKDGDQLEAVATALGEGPLKAFQPGDSLRLFHGYRSQTFLTNGKTYRVIWVRDEPGTVEDAIVREKESPIVLEGDKVIGTGWTFFDKTAQEVGLPNPYRSKERLDSIAKAATKS
jgi:hypothetical protein